MATEGRMICTHLAGEMWICEAVALTTDEFDFPLFCPSPEVFESVVALSAVSFRSASAFRFESEASFTLAADFLSADGKPAQGVSPATFCAWSAEGSSTARGVKGVVAWFEASPPPLGRTHSTLFAPGPLTLSFVGPGPAFPRRSQRHRFQAGLRTLGRLLRGKVLWHEMEPCVKFQQSRVRMGQAVAWSGEMLTPRWPRALQAPELTKFWTVSFLHKINFRCVHRSQNFFPENLRRM